MYVSIFFQIFVKTLIRNEMTTLRNKKSNMASQLFESA